MFPTSRRRGAAPDAPSDQSESAAKQQQRNAKCHKSLKNRLRAPRNRSQTIPTPKHGIFELNNTRRPQAGRETLVRHVNILLTFRRKSPSYQQATSTFWESGFKNYLAPRLAFFVKQPGGLGCKLHSKCSKYNLAQLSRLAGGFITYIRV